ncbi:MAG: hypothetical protein CMO66_04925 [Verrucomicrobiales bacterium]|nr:hypothetical protein [Verrucomicrobiales bacterium]
MTGVNELAPLESMGAVLAAWAPGRQLPPSLRLVKGQDVLPAALAAGEAWVEANGGDGLIDVLPSLLDEGQSACVFANLAGALAAEDSREGRAALRELGELLKINDRDGRDLVRSLECLASRDLLREREEWVGCTAVMIGLSAADGEEVGEESKWLEEFAGEAGVLTEARALLDERGKDDLIEKVEGLGSRQRNFLMANLMVLMFVDGKWSGEEQALLDECCEKLRVMSWEAEGQLKAIHTMFNLSVFG